MASPYLHILPGWAETRSEMFLYSAIHTLENWDLNLNLNLEINRTF